ncbi:uncharacterized protein LOC117786412 [Drosophila innubila]|uniref:uncharacterized protein LOC117786412 n=1 Tax=Drosophila innubila TaxID=198719 RepID=UPI00148CFC19|nr:uncharacterized protein LOC117786412 [Drosophila innubila]
MSGLERFEDTPEWREKLRNHLLFNRGMPVSRLTGWPNNYRGRNSSVDIVIDFPALIKAKKAELKKKQEEEEDKAKERSALANISSDMEMAKPTDCSIIYLSSFDDSQSVIEISDDEKSPQTPDVSVPPPYSRSSRLLNKKYRRI